MLRNLVLLMILLLAPRVQAQVNEIGITGGTLFYIGDLNPTRWYPKNTKLGGGLVFRHNMTDRLAVRLQGLYGTLQAYDSNSDDPVQQFRDLHFRARLFEASALFEVNFFKYRSRGKESHNWTPFLFAGLAYFRANPQAEYNGTWYELPPLGTEGQGTQARPDSEPYKVDQLALPFGAGMKFNLGRVDLQIELSLRRTWTDHIDDVSGTYVDNALLEEQNGPLAAALADRSAAGTIPGFSNTGRARGDSNTTDWYQYTGVSLTYIISRFSDCDAQYDWMRKKR